MDDVDLFAADQGAQGIVITELRQRIFAVDRHRHDQGAGLFQPVDQASATGGDDRTAASLEDGVADVEHGLLDAAGVEFRNDLQDAGM